MGETAESDAEPFPDEEDEAEESLTELLEQLGREVTALVFYETRLAASRYTPELRRAGRDVAAALLTGLAFLTAFALANAAAVRALSITLSDWVAPLVLAAAWTAVGALLALFLRARAKRVKWWAAKDAEEARAEAEQAVRETLERLAPAITGEIASAAIPMAGGVFDAGEEIIESADEIIDTITEDVPGGGVVNQVWDIVLMPGRFGLRVATTVLKRGDSSS